MRKFLSSQTKAFRHTPKTLTHKFYDDKGLFVSFIKDPSDCSAKDISLNDLLNHNNLSSKSLSIFTGGNGVKQHAMRLNNGMILPFLIFNDDHLRLKHIGSFPSKKISETILSENEAEKLRRRQVAFLRMNLGDSNQPSGWQCSSANLGINETIADIIGGLNSVGGIAIQDIGLGSSSNFVEYKDKLNTFRQLMPDWPRMDTRETEASLANIKKYSLEEALDMPRQYDSEQSLDNHVNILGSIMQISCLKKLVDRYAEENPIPIFLLNKEHTEFLSLSISKGDHKMFEEFGNFIRNRKAFRTVEKSPDNDYCQLFLKFSEIAKEFNHIVINNNIPNSLLFHDKIYQVQSRVTYFLFPNKQLKEISNGTQDNNIEESQSAFKESNKK